MTTNAYLGQLGKLYLNASTIDTGTDALEQFRDLTFGQSTEQSDLTNNDSDAGYRDNVDTFKSNSATLEVIIDPNEPSVQTDLIAASRDGSDRNFEHHPRGTASGRPSETFVAQVRLNSRPHVTADYVKYTFDLNIRGAITYGTQ